MSTQPSVNRDARDLGCVRLGGMGASLPPAAVVPSRVPDATSTEDAGKVRLGGMSPSI